MRINERVKAPQESSLKEEIAKRHIAEAIEHVSEIYAYYRKKQFEDGGEPYTDDDVTINILVNVMHYCWAKNISFGENLDIAYQHYFHERVTAGSTILRGPIEREAEEKQNEKENSKTRLRSKESK